MIDWLRNMLFQRRRPEDPEVRKQQARVRAQAVDVKATVDRVTQLTAKILDDYRAQDGFRQRRR